MDRYNTPPKHPRGKVQPKMDDSHSLPCGRDSPGRNGQLVQKLDKNPLRLLQNQCRSSWACAQRESRKKQGTSSWKQSAGGSSSKFVSGYRPFRLYDTNLPSNGSCAWSVRSSGAEGWRDEFVHPISRKSVRKRLHEAIEGNHWRDP